MNDRISRLLNQMTDLEEELSDALHEQETRVSFIIRGKKVEFEQSVKDEHRKLKTRFFRWLVTNRPQNLITGPIIYTMIFSSAYCRSYCQLLSADLLPDIQNFQSAPW